MAGVILTRDPKLGFRMKVQAMPTGREIHRLVSDCPLAITEQTLLWLQRHKWQWKLHPNSLDVRELLKQVKTYTNLLPAEHISDACDLLLENFRPKGGSKTVKEHTSNRSQAAAPSPQESTSMPSQEEMMQQMAMMQQQMMAMQQHMVSGQPAAPLDPLQAKMMKTRKRHAETMAQVNQTLAMNAKKEAMQKEVLENLDDIVSEVDSIIQDEPLDEEIHSEEMEIEIPEKFNSPQEAWAWAVDLGVYDDLDEAQKEYAELKKSEQPKNAIEMASVWTSTCLAIYDMLNEDSEEDSGE